MVERGQSSQMNQPAHWSGHHLREAPGVLPPKRLSVLKFFMRYPLFLLAFGPPVFRTAGVDVTEGTLDVWSFLQAGLIFAIAGRAILRLATVRSILIPREVRSVLKYGFLLSLLFMASTLYSPSRLSTGAYSILYFLVWVCIAEFIADAYRNPPDWVQCVLQLRLIAFFLFALVLACLAIDPVMVMAILPGVGIRLSGNAVAPVPFICPMMMLVSAYAFLYSLEPRSRSVFFFLVGLAGILAVRSRGCEISLFLSLSILGLAWAKTTKRSAYKFIAAVAAVVLLSGITVAFFGAEHIWSTFNRGQSTANLESASGRTEMWKFIVQYCMAHPQGMGYVAGFRIVFRQYFSLSAGNSLSQLGTAHNTLFDILAGAGWLALAVYLILLAKLVWLAWRFIRRQSQFNPACDSVSRHGIRCSLLLLFYCFVYGMGATEFLAPLRAGFYYEYILFAIILGASARILAVSRGGHVFSPSGPANGPQFK
jgi:O-antigen ligase